jgi:DNA-binding XRE family transcriptional regulator
MHTADAMATRPGRRALKGKTVDEWLKEEEKRDPGFIAAVDEEALRLVTAAEVKKLREAAGVTQTELAEKISTTQSSIARMESGKALPDLLTLQRIGTALGYAVAVSFKPRKKSGRG